MARSNFLGALDKLVAAKDKKAAKRTPSRQALKQNLGTRTQKPVKQQDLSSKTDPQGSNAKRSTKGGFRPSGMSVGMRF